MKKSIAIQGKSIYYSIQGCGPVIVLLHGFLENMSIWEKLAYNLSKANQVLCVDLPGFGESDVFSHSHSMDFMADVLNNILNEEKILNCILVGHSMGGYVGLAFAKKHESKLKGLVLFHSQAAADDAEGKRNRDRTINAVNNNHKGFISAFVPSLFAANNIGIFSDEIEKLKKVSESTSVEGICAALAGMRDREDHVELLKSLDIPVLFIVGKQDEKISLEKILPQMQCPKNSEALILDGVGHMGFIEAEEITSLAIDHFSQRINSSHI